MTEASRTFEELVARIEKRLSPSGSTVTSPDRIRDVRTGQLRECDATVRYTVGSAAVLILIECRERAATQDVTWLEQLATKRTSVGADVVVAVSASPFTTPAREMGAALGIRLRTIDALTDAEIDEWSQSLVIDLVIIERSLTTLTIELAPEAPDDELRILDSHLSSWTSDPEGSPQIVPRIADSW